MMLQINLIDKIRIIYLKSYKHYEIFYYNCTNSNTAQWTSLGLGLGLQLWSIVGKVIKDVEYVMMVTKFGRIPEWQQWIVGCIL